MFYSVRGKLIHTTSSNAVIECGGVGYNCQTTINTLKTLKINTDVMLYTHLNVRENAMELFGFATKAELGCKVRSVELNIVQRCAGHIVSRTDIEESVLVGKSAVKAASEGVTR